MKARTWLAGSALGVVLLTACGGGGGVDVRSEGAASSTLVAVTTSSTVPASDAATCGDPAQDLDEVPKDLPKLDEPQLVLGPDCQIGEVAAADFFGDERGPKDFAPIHPRGGGDEVIGYWVVELGWVTPEVAKASGWDAERARSIAPPRYPLVPGEPG